MSSDPGTLTPPTSMGWYIVWGNGPRGRLAPALYFCVEGTSDVQCMSARPAENEEFLPLCHDSFSGAYWAGPYATRREASTALGALPK